MPLPDPADETRFAEAFRRARILGLALCYGTILPYGLVWFLAAFQGDAARFREALGGALHRLLNGHVVACALLEAVAVYGLVMGFVEGPGTAPLTLAMLLVPPVAYPFLVPGEAAWREAVAGPTGGLIRG